MLKVGDKAPDFRLKTDGREVALPDLRGKPVVLYFTPKPTLPVEPTKRPSFVTPKANSTSWAR